MLHRIEKVTVFCVTSETHVDCKLKAHERWTAGESWSV